jgi:hypothetical protein
MLENTEGAKAVQNLDILLIDMFSVFFADHSFFLYDNKK